MLELNKIYCKDIIDGIKLIDNKSIDLLVTSPPYANQRKNIYGGIPEKDYPNWTVKWMQEVKRIIKSSGNVVINIRPNLKDGQISDYVLRTVLSLREDNWQECEELVWLKPDGAPLGSLKRPRRSYEMLYWFSLNAKNAFCDVTANGNHSNRIGLSVIKGVNEGYINGGSKPREGIARSRDYIEVPVGTVDRSEYNTHPAQYPEGLSSWIIKMLCPENGIVLDPFMGSGTSAVSCLKNNRKFIGFEISQEYCDIANKRLKNIQ